MEGLKHMSHDHPLILTKYSDTLKFSSVCCGCHQLIKMGTDVYRCSRTGGTSIATLDPSCIEFFLHKTCSELPPQIQDPRHEPHLLTLAYASSESPATLRCEACHNQVRLLLVYNCEQCKFLVCLKCTAQERNLSHELHSHPLTLLPQKSVFTCEACGVKGSEEFSYLCRTCLFWMHESCALAPKTLICKLHHNDHPLLLSNYIPEGYRMPGLVCSICRLEFYDNYWLYFCADCRFFAHMECATKPKKEKTILVDEEFLPYYRLLPYYGMLPYWRLPLFPADEFYLNSLTFSTVKKDKFPVYDDQQYKFSLIQLFSGFGDLKSSESHIYARSGLRGIKPSSESDIIRQCARGHPLVLRKDYHDLNQLLCDGCFLPLSLSPDSFYACVDCKFFLHKICACKLPGTVLHLNHHHNNLNNRPKTMFLKCQQIGILIKCVFCRYKSNGIFYTCEEPRCSYIMDIRCATLPLKIKHESHQHCLTMYYGLGTCRGCPNRPNHAGFFACDSCEFQLHVGCAISPGRVKHRWDEHPLRLMYPPVKNHPHDFDCEFCSKVVNPYYWFYHCRTCDMSFHLKCVQKGGLLDSVHRHGLRFPNLE